MGKIAYSINCSPTLYSITHSPSLFDVPGTEAFALRNNTKIYPSAKHTETKPNLM